MVQLRNGDLLHRQVQLWEVRWSDRGMFVMGQEDLGRLDTVLID